MKYWSALTVLRQLSGELGLPVQNTTVDADNIQGSQLLAALNAAGSELQLYYPWSQFTVSYDLSTFAGQEKYKLPDDFRYFTDQTQWDVQEHWPLDGPQTSSEWAVLKNGVIPHGPRTRFRQIGDYIMFNPVPADTRTLNMEYVSANWAISNAGAGKSLVDQDNDTVCYDPWLAVKFAKLKFLQLKGLDTTAAQADFTRVFNSLRGKDVGARTLSLTGDSASFQLIGIHSVPEGSWNVGR